MPMAGAGSRFVKAGYSIPKPLIPVDGVPMFQKALSSISDIEAQKDYFFIIRQENVDKQRLDKLIKDALPEANIVVVPKLTNGAAETALAAETSLNPNDALIVMDCDIWFKSKGYKETVEESLKEPHGDLGVLLTFTSEDPRYCYVSLDDNNLVTDIVEKKVISNHAVTGAYFFSSANLFVDAGTYLLKKPLNSDVPEYYLSSVYKLLVDQGLRIKATTVDEFASFGTPEELSHYKSAGVGQK